VAKLMFKEMGEDLNVRLTMMPAKIRGKYQFYTKAETKKLRKAGYKRQFTSLDDGIKKYVKYLETQTKRGLLKA
jgi:ADP-L-glycero-D-manno-heptose 6-epimerase